MGILSFIKKGGHTPLLFLFTLLFFFITISNSKPYAYISDENLGVYVVDLKTLRLIKTIPLRKWGIRGIGVVKNGKYIVAAAKKRRSLVVIDTGNYKVVKEIKIGDNPEFVKVSPFGNTIFATYELKGKEERAFIVAVDAKRWKKVFGFVGGSESEGMTFSKDSRYLIVANEGEHSLSVFDLKLKKKVREIELREYGKRPRGLNTSPDGNYYVVTFESSNDLLVLDRNFTPVKKTKTSLGPYGVTFSPNGKRVVVASFRAHKLEIFSFPELQKVGEVQTGKRCWHFSYSPDASKLIVPCGRSQEVLIFDAESLKLLKRIKLKGGKPWGAVTYPRAWGSIDTPF